MAYIYFFLGLVQQLTNLTAALSRLIKGDLFLYSTSLVLFLNLAFSNSLTLQCLSEKLSESLALLKTLYVSEKVSN